MSRLPLPVPASPEALLAAAPSPEADRAAVHGELLRLSTEPGRPVLAIQFLLDCGVAALFAWQYSLPLAALWLGLIALTTGHRALFPQRLPDPLTPERVPAALRQHTLRIGVHEGAHGLAGVLLFNPQDTLTQLLLGMVMMGMTLSSAFSVSYYARAMQLGITVLLVPIIAMGLLFGAPPMVGLALLGAALLLMMWRQVADRSRKLEDSIAQRHNESALRAQALAGLVAAHQAQAERLRFFSAANHDLRQPVMAIGLQVEVLRQQVRAGDAASVQATLAALAQAQEALGALTQQLLEIGRIEAGADALAPEAISLATLFGEFARQAGAQRVRVRCPAGATAWSDPVALRRIVANLVDNALKFAPAPHGRVLLACRRRGGRWRLEVRDNGIGIDAQAHERVFGDFEQIGNAERNLRRGHGLGLAIVRRLAAQLGTQVTLRSALGRGSVFALEVPAAAPLAAAPLRAMPPAPPVGRDAADPKATGSGLAVLVVEDNAVVADSLAALLRQWDAWPCVYANAAEAIALADVPQLGLALCDIRLPGEMDGVALASWLQRARPELTIALVSADIDEATRALARERGWHALRKPVQPATLRALLANAAQARAGS